MNLEFARSVLHLSCRLPQDMHHDLPQHVVLPVGTPTFLEIDQTLFVHLFTSKSCSNHTVLLLKPKFQFMLLVSFCWSRVMPNPEFGDFSTILTTRRHDVGLDGSERFTSEVHAEAIEQVLHPMWQSKPFHW